MKHVLTIMIAILVCVACSNKKTETAAISKKIAVAYVTSWSNEMPDPTYITHINYAFGHVNDDFNGIRIDNEDRLRQIVALKNQAPHLKVLISIGGWGSGRFSEMAADKVFRESFAADCQRVAKEFNLDGIDIDWEYPTSDMGNISASPEDYDNYTYLMRDIRAAIGPDKLLTHATSAGARYYDFKALDQYLDFTNIMAYDMGMPPYHHSALYRSEIAGGNTSDEAVKAHLAAGVPKHKLVLGVPFYGKADRGFQRPADMLNAHEMEGYFYHWDDTAKVPYLADADGVLVYGYENLESLSIKCQYILDNDLLGVMYWSYSGDNEAGDMRRTVYTVLNGK